MKDGRFEVGDRVRCVDPGFSGLLTFEAEYTVTAMDENPAPVHVDGMNRSGRLGWAGGRFELVDPNAPQYRDVDMQPGVVLDTTADGVTVTTEPVGGDGWWDVDPESNMPTREQLAGIGLEMRVQVRRKP